MLMDKKRGDDYHSNHVLKMLACTRIQPANLSLAQNDMINELDVREPDSAFIRFV